MTSLTYLFFVVVVVFPKDVVVMKDFKGTGNSRILLKITNAKFREHYWGVMQDSTTQTMMVHFGTFMKVCKSSRIWEGKEGRGLALE